MAVGEHGVGPAGVEAVDFPFIGAVEGTRARALAPIGRRTLKNDPVIKGCPGTPFNRLVRPRPPQTPESRPAGIFGEQDGLGRAVGDLALQRVI